MVGVPSATLAFTAGFVSFLSPCCLPLVPGYLATVGGGAPTQRAVLVRSGLFVASFSLAFIALGLTATALGQALAGNQVTLTRISGVAIIAMGLLMVGSAFSVRLNRQVRVRRLDAAASAGSPVVAGLAFAFAWTPCIGPTLGAILGLAASSQSSGSATLLLTIYSAGLAVPFLLCALAFGRAQAGITALRRHQHTIQIVAGVSLIVMGYLVLSGELFRLNIEAQRILNEIGLNVASGI